MFVGVQVRGTAHGKTPIQTEEDHMRKELIGAASAAALLVCGTAWAQGTATQSDQTTTTTTQGTTSPGATSPGTMGQGTTSTSPGVTSPGATAPGTTGDSALGGSAAGGLAGSRTSAENLMGKNVVDASGEELGEVKDVIMDANTGEARQIVISSGGFLGIGAKDIAVPFQQAQIQPGSDNVTVSGLSRDQIEQMPEFEYDENTVSLSRDRGQSETNSTTTTTRSGSGSGSGQ